MVMECRSEIGKPVIMAICGTLVYYHCAYREVSLLSLFSDVFIVILCSLAILGLLFRQINISVPVDPLEWQISQDTANSIVACLANTFGAAESVLRVAATGHDKRLFLKVVFCLYVLSALGRVVSGLTVAYAGLCLFCLYMLAENTQSISAPLSWFRRTGNGTNADITLEDDAM
ncbi:reticulon-like protein B22 [Morus notabilis]|uniref:reticulon-like protein B22 n=1 Tax=Morus notabilis TaxID=981085 RepID=UPI000CED2CB1|nr:reticulon-like protein B22 [Morus notabilis]